VGWAIVVHGGARAIEDDRAAEYRSGCEAAVAAGIAVLAVGGPAHEAAVTAVRVLESDPTFNAGVGAARNAEGRVQCDAAVMDGATLDIGAVAGVEAVRHPIDVADALLRAEQTLLIAAGAERFAAERGLDGPPLSGRRRAEGESHDTVGCAALDASGHLAAAVSTGGLDGMPPGRVGDSPLAGAGFLADDEVGAVVLSGIGERIVRATLAAWTSERLRDGDPASAVGLALDRLQRVGGEAGLIVIDPSGRLGWGHSSRDFAVAWATDRRPVTSFTRSSRPGGWAEPGDNQ